jgi:hypothetical protein
MEKMCDIIKTVICTDKGFKEVHLADVSKFLFEHCGAKVTSTQVYSHLRKGARWIHISKLRDLSGGQWDEDSCSIMLEAHHYQGHVMVEHQTVLHLSFSHSWATSNTLTCRTSLGSPQGCQVPQQEDPQIP